MSNLFVFNFSGEMIHAAVNYPGSWHDSKIAIVSGFYRKLRTRTPAGMAILADTAFISDTRKTLGRLVRSRKVNERRDIPLSTALNAIDILQQREMPSERKGAEWGVHGAKQPFGRYKRALPADSTRRLTMFSITCHLYNLRVRLVGRNQIQTVYSRRQRT